MSEKSPDILTEVDKRIKASKKYDHSVQIQSIDHGDTKTVYTYNPSNRIKIYVMDKDGKVLKEESAERFEIYEIGEEVDLPGREGIHVKGELEEITGHGKNFTFTVEGNTYDQSNFDYSITSGGTRNRLLGVIRKNGK